ncbi:MAG: helix-turn-helix domain-containing protein [Lachnospiraceae bacterium]|nr:helix-turn-helix domain-containing protein [Lachnospiraceae bacterium]MBP5494629.1 helix-turn-helix domain-containing protein [Lachnospiraceae bacterium]
MSKFFDDLKTGLEEAIEIEKGLKKGRSTTFIFEPVKKYTNTEIKAIRNKAGMTQAAFASYLGVSVKTVEAWELGRTHPTGPAFRLINILDEGKEKELSFITKI